jgi:hypothetical protein
MRRALVSAAIGAVLCAAACGEDVDFSSGGADAGADHALLEAAPGEAAPMLASDGEASTPSEAGPLEDATTMESGCAGGSACRENGTPCRSTKDCCSNRCEEGYCLPPGACAAPGAPCSTRSGCCSGRCEPAARSGMLACAQYCLADGVHCQDADDCCSLACNGGVCGGALCLTAGSTCTTDSGCCSAHCEANHCVPVTAVCLPTGEGCGDESGMQCCSDFCNAKTGRCDLGPGGCRESSSPCNVDGDCCRGQCERNAQGIDVCTAPCLADGQDCNSNGDCCEGLCGGPLSRCEALPPGCP